MRFVDKDVEAASTEVASTHQLGTAKYTNGDHSDLCTGFIDPEDDYNTRNHAIHGIYASTVDLPPPLSDVSRPAHTARPGNAAAYPSGTDRLHLNQSFIQTQTKAHQIHVAGLCLSRSAYAGGPGVVGEQGLTKLAQEQRARSIRRQRNRQQR